MRWIIAIGWSLVLLACHPKEYPKLLQSEEIALANPIITIDSVLFKHQATISVLPPYAQADVRYTTNGEAVTKTSPLCSNPLILNKNTDIQFKAFHPDFQPSETALFSVRKAGNTQFPDSKKLGGIIPVPI